ncbi:MAG: glycosyltransferase [Caulobacterales bacterium]
MKLSVVYATAGRADIVGEALSFLTNQTRLADEIIISAPSPADVPPVDPALPIKVVFGPKGLPAQRNTAMRALDPDSGIIIYFDDDFAPAPDYLEAAERLIQARADIAGLTGHVIADGIGGPGFTFQEAAAYLGAAGSRVAGAEKLRRIGGLYGCNMVMRRSLADGLTFDETLPGYAWQEDIDFTMQLGRRGRLYWTDALIGVHLGVKSARSPGKPMGYAQIANPIFMRRKRTVSIRHAYPLMIRNVAANMIKSLKPEPWCDRKGRLRGNLQAISDLMRGRLHPRNILDLK